MNMQELNTLIKLSHEFGTPDYVKGGGGNTSFKNETHMWIKPSGTTLGGLTRETLVDMNRAKINELYEVKTPESAADREELVKNRMANAVETSTGRPSVEAPLHNVFEAAYVVHTHAVLVNGMTCAEEGEAACRRLFPDALWVEYIDPGYTLCMEVRERIQAYRQQHGHEPALVILQNHGIFVAGDTPDEIRAIYARVMDALTAAYAEAGIAATLEVPKSPVSSDMEEEIRTVFGSDAAFIASSGLFAITPEAISPDHMVYSRAYPFFGELTESGAAAYHAAHGYAPKLVVTGDGVYGVGDSQKNADLSLELAQDGSLVMQLAEAFGGIHYMTPAHVEFIENWEVEAYRQQQV
jgi:rhamnose utilization protein RhaD (predicted bifunctional aldolase and dehydrogenase)